MGKIFFTSDHHFGHKRILGYTSRPFSTLDEMNNTMIERWNSKVSPEDEVYHLGDVGLLSPGKLRKILDQLNGKIYLLRGNHEKSAEACHSRFEWIKDYYELRVPDADHERGEQLIVLCHYAFRVWNAHHWGSYHLFGHSHGTLSDDPKAHAIDIGVDCHDFYPLSYEEVKAIMQQKQWSPPYQQERE